MFSSLSIEGDFRPPSHALRVGWEIPSFSSATITFNLLICLAVLAKNCDYLCFIFCEIAVIITFITLTITVNFYLKCESNAVRIDRFLQFWLFKAVGFQVAIYRTAPGRSIRLLL